MTARAKDSPRDPFHLRPVKRTPLEAAEAARRRMDDPAYRVEVDRRRGRGAVRESLRPLRAGAARGLRRRLGDRGGTAVPADRGDRREAAHDHRQERFARHPASTSRSIPIAAASTAAPIASRGRPMPSRACPRASISRPRSLPSPMRRSFWRRSCAPRATSRPPSRSARTPIPYQPVERRFRITRSILEVLSRMNHPVGIVTKSALVTRDIDILSQMADRQLAKVAISITTLDPKLARRMEPRAATPGQAPRDDPQAHRGRHSGDACSSPRSSRRSTITRSRPS